MTRNVGGIDRILRIVLGLALIGLTLTGTIGAWGWIGLVPLATAAMGFCPLYTPAGLQHLPAQAAERRPPASTCVGALAATLRRSCATRPSCSATTRPAEAMVSGGAPR
jgi:hypothetical protein